MSLLKIEKSQPTSAPAASAGRAERGGVHRYGTYCIIYRLTCISSRVKADGAEVRWPPSCGTCQLAADCTGLDTARNVHLLRYCPSGYVGQDKSWDKRVSVISGAGEVSWYSAVSTRCQRQA